MSENSRPKHADQAPSQATLPTGLYLVASPIGAARDITLRALDILEVADVIAAEDTRRARKLLDLHAIKIGERPLLSYHDHSPPEARAALLRALSEGQVVAYLSDAGTPLVADPGYLLARGAISQGSAVHAAPGASAVLAALTLSGLPSDRFLFAGFPPRKGDVQAWLTRQAAARCTLILYESPKRVHRMLAELQACFGADTQIALCRELTKRYEEVLRGSIETVIAEIADRSLKGEIVLVVAAAGSTDITDATLRTHLLAALREARLKEAVAHVAAELELPRRRVYQMALMLQEDGARDE